MNKQAFIFFGRSGGGKGTQANLLIEHLKKEKDADIVYIETGEKFREFIAKENNHISSLTRSVLDEGELLPVFLPIWIWTRELIEKYTGNETLVLDGLCRRLDEAPVLDSALEFLGINKPKVIFINTSREWSLNRLRERGREDDDREEDMIRKLDWFDKYVVPAMSYFKDKEGYEFIEINGEQSIEEVHKEILSKI